MRVSAAPELPRAERLRQELRADIVRAAAECFAEAGYHRTGIADIARRLGIGNSSIYAHFAGKRALLDAVVGDSMGRLTGVLVADNAPAAADTFAAYQEQARRIAHGFTALAAEDPTLVRLLRMLLVEAGDVDDELAAKGAAFLETSARLTAAYLRHGQERGYLRASLDADATARVVNGLILAIALEQTSGTATAAENERVLDAALELYFGGVRAR